MGSIDGVGNGNAITIPGKSKTFWFGKEAQFSCIKSIDDVSTVTVVTVVTVFVSIFFRCKRVWTKFKIPPLLYSNVETVNTVYRLELELYQKVDEIVDIFR